MPDGPTLPISTKWQTIAARLRNEASALPAGKSQDAMLAKANQLDTACQINDWISSGEQAPIEIAALLK